MIELKAEIPREARGWRNDPAIWQWCRQHTLIDETQHARWLDKISTDPTIKMFGVYCASGAPVGVCGLTSIDPVNQTAEFSLYIEPKNQKTGFGRQALKMLLAHGFYDWNLNKIWGETFDGNPAHGMFVKLGMKNEGTLRDQYFRDGKFINVHRVAILREEFTRLHSPHGQNETESTPGESHPKD